MTKTFKEVFPTLKLDKDMENLLENADVTRISVNHARDFYKIYVKAKRLIFKKNIWKLEESIKKQIFKSKDITVKIIESYELSSQYTPKTLFDVYFDSILDEINSHSVLLYNLLRTSKWSFTDDTHVTVTLEETIIAKTRGNSVIEFLEKVFCERCGMDFIVNLQYEKPKISKYRQNADKQIEQEVQNIVARTKFAMAKDDGDEDAKVAVDDGAMFVGGSENTSDTKKSGTQILLKPEIRRMKRRQVLIKSLRRSLKRSSTRSLRKSSSAKEISGANMTMTLISCTEEALMMRRCPLKRLTVLSVRLQ